MFITIPSRNGDNGMKADSFIGIEQDWTHLVRSIIRKDWDFVNFNFIKFEVEVDRITGRIEIYFAFMGICLYIFISFDEMDENLKNRIQRLQADKD